MCMCVCNTACQQLEQERLDHTSLKRTWQMANDQFLSSQRQLLSDVRRMESVLTAEQKIHIAGQLCSVLLCRWNSDV